MLMVVDEAHVLCTARNCPRPLYYAVTLGRHRKLSLIYAAQRFAQVTRIITANTDEFLFWRISEPLDIVAIRDRCGADVAEAVANLRPTELVNGIVKPGEILRWTKERGAEILT
jgi:hypothetical protein